MMCAHKQKSNPLINNQWNSEDAGRLNAGARAKRRSDKRSDPEVLDEKDAFSHELMLKLHQGLLILLVGRRENTQVTEVQLVVVAGDAQLFSLSRHEQVICVWKVLLLITGEASSWDRELKEGHGKTI